MTNEMRTSDQWKKWFANQIKPQSYDNYNVNAFDYESDNQKNNVGIPIPNIPGTFSGTNSPIPNTPNPFDSFMKLPWMSTPGNTITDSKTGNKTFTPGITGKFDTLGGYGKNVLEGLSLWQNIQGGRAQAENAKLYGTFMKDQLAAAQDARRFNNERSKVQHRLNVGESANTAYATLNNWSTV